MDDQTVLKIEIPVEDETVYQPETTKPDVNEQISRTMQQVSATAVNLWQSKSRQKATRKIGRAVNAATVKTGLLIQQKLSDLAAKGVRQEAASIQTRVQETDWSAELRNSGSNGLRWVSQRAAQLADRTAVNNTDAETPKNQR